MNRPPIATIRSDDLRARELSIRCKILDGIEQTLDEIARSDRLRAAAERATLAHYAALLCRHARCRRQPCAVPSAPSAK